MPKTYDELMIWLDDMKDTASNIWDVILDMIENMDDYPEGTMEKMESLLQAYMNIRFMMYRTVEKNLEDAHHYIMNMGGGTGDDILRN